MSPVKLIKVQQQIYVANRGGGWSSSSSSLVQHWQRGLTATLLRDGIPHGVWFASYEWSKTELTRQLLDMEDPQHPSYGIGSLTTMNQVGVPMMAGAVAATVAWVRVLLSASAFRNESNNHSPIFTINRPLDIPLILSRLGFKPPTYS
jgi:solute carrier family 25 carnitine/acylcarnitine transporter 20/29